MSNQFEDLAHKVKGRRDSSSKHKLAKSIVKEIRKINPSITLSEMSIGFDKSDNVVAIINVDYVMALDIKEALIQQKSIIKYIDVRFVPNDTFPKDVNWNIK